MTASVSQIARSVGDPSTAAAYFEPVAHWLRDQRRRRAARVEVPPTANHWESAYLAPEVELARGWLRQLDTTRDDIFYGDDGQLTDAAYSAWLRDNAIRFVALPDAPLDYSSVAERRLILRDPPYLALRWRSPDWRVYAVQRPRAPGRADRRRGGARALGSATRASPSTSSRPGRLPGPGQLHPLLVDRPRRGLPAAPRRLDPGPRRQPRRLPRRRRLLARPRLERGDRRPQDLLTSAA